MKKALMALAIFGLLGGCIVARPYPSGYYYGHSHRHYRGCGHAGW